MKCKHCRRDIIQGSKGWADSTFGFTLCGDPMIPHEPAEPVAAPAVEPQNVCTCYMKPHRYGCPGRVEDIQTKATSLPPYKCSVCNKSFNTIDEYKNSKCISIEPEAGSTHPERDQSNIDNEKLLDDMIERLRPRPEMPSEKSKRLTKKEQSSARRREKRAILAAMPYRTAEEWADGMVTIKETMDGPVHSNEWQVVFCGHALPAKKDKAQVERHADSLRRTLRKKLRHYGAQEKRALCAVFGQRQKEGREILLPEKRAASVQQEPLSAALRRLVDEVPRNGQCDEVWKQAEAALKSQPAAPRTQGREPIQLNHNQETLCRQWAADDRLWTTQETVEFNLKTFARSILVAGEARTQPAPHPQVENLALEIAEAIRHKQRVSNTYRDNQLVPLIISKLQSFFTALPEATKEEKTIELEPHEIDFEKLHRKFLEGRAKRLGCTIKEAAKIRRTRESAGPDVDYED